MKLKKVGCKYFMGFGPYTEIEFPSDVNVIGLLGQWESNPERSNQAGKSSFIEVIWYNLFGESRIKQVELINKDFDEDMLTICTYILDDGQEITIIRGRTINNKAILELDGYEGDDKDNVDKVIEKLVGMSYKDADMTCYFRQNEMHTFMKAGPTEQKKLITMWLDKPHWSKLEKQAKTTLSELEGKINEEHGFIKYSNEQLQNRDNLEEHLAGLSITIKKLKDDHRIVLGELEEANKRLSDLQKIAELNDEKIEVEKQITSLQKRVSQLKDRIQEGETHLAEAEERQKQITKLENSLTMIDEVKSGMTSIRKRISDVNAEKRVQEERIQQLKAQYRDVRKFGGTCPVTSKTCTIIDKDATLEEITAKAEELKDDLDIMNLQLKNQEELLQINEERYESLNNKSRELAKLKGKDSVGDIEKRISHLKDESIEAKEMLAQVVKRQVAINKKLSGINVTDNLEHVEEEVFDLTKQASKSEKKLKDTESEISQTQGSLKELDKLEEQIEKSNQRISALIDEGSHYKFLTFMFGKAGIPSHQVESAFDELEEEINYILKCLQADFQVRFEAVRELKQLEDVCSVCGFSYPNAKLHTCPDCESERQRKRKDELNIKVIKGKNEYEFAAMSGGAQVLITFAVRISLIRMQRRRAKTRIKFAVMDEVLASLDSVNKENLLQVVTKVIIEELGVEQIFLISHTEVKNYIPNIILVKKGKKFTTFGWMAEEAEHG